MKITAMRPHLLPLGLLLLAAVLPYWRIALGLDCLAGDDLLNQNIVWKHFWVECVKNGDFPLWNPHAFCGSPFLANVQTGNLYPIETLSLLIDPFLFFGWATLFHVWLAGIGVYGLIWDPTKNRWAGFFGAMVFCHAGTTAFDATVPMIRNLFPMAWAVWVIWFTWRMLRQPTRWRFLWMAVATSMMWLSGSPQFGIYGFYAVLLTGIYHLAFGGSREHGLGEALKRLLWAMGAFCLGMALAGVQLVPMYELATFSANRAGGARYEFATIDSYPPYLLVTSLFPDLFGVPWRGDWWASGTGYHEICTYLGLPVIVLAVAAAIALPWKTTRFWLLLGLAALLLSFGRFTPFYRIPHAILPGFAMVRVPARILFLLTLPVSVLCGFSFDRLAGSANRALERVTYRSLFIGILAIMIALWGTLILRPWITDRFNAIQISRFLAGTKQSGIVPTTIDLSQQRLAAEGHYRVFLHAFERPLITGFLMLFILWIGGRISRRGLVSGLVAALVFFDLSTFLYPAIRSVPRKESFQRAYGPSDSLKYLIELQNRSKQPGRYVQMDDLVSWYLRDRMQPYQPNRPQIHGLYSVRGSDPIILRHYSELVNEILGVPKDEFPGPILLMPKWNLVHRDLFRLLACRYVLTTADIPGLPLLHRGDVHVYEFPDALPRAFIDVGEGEKHEIPAIFIEDSPDRVVLRGDAPRPGELILLDTWYPGWQAMVNGQEVPVKRWKAFRSVDVPAGPLEVECTF
jgi:hypothetical protein